MKTMQNKNCLENVVKAKGPAFCLLASIKVKSSQYDLGTAWKNLKKIFSFYFH
jgi:hypothetical protein